jgi:hypothetical protein
MGRRGKQGEDHEYLLQYLPEDMLYIIGSALGALVTGAI